MKPLVVDSQSEAHTRAIAAKVASIVTPGTIVALEGPLGAGKTIFVRGMAEALGLDPVQVSSPTFVICHEYLRAPAGFPLRSPQSDPPIALIHIDAYRIKSQEDLESIGWNEIVQTENAILAIEWPSRMAGGLDGLEHRLVTISMMHTGDHSRSITIEAPASIVAQLQSAFDDNHSTSPAPAVSSRLCPTCGKTVPSNAPEFPFCSARCRLAELNKWFNERYRVSRPIEADEELDE